MAEGLGRSDRRSRIVGIAGAVVGLVAGALVVRELVDQWDATVEAVRGADPAWLVVAAAAGGVGMVAIAWVWSAVLAALGAPVARGRTVRWYFLGELGKYLPGGVWTVVGRAELARRGGVARPVAYGSVAVSLVALYLAAAGVAALLVPFDLARQRDDPRVAVAAAVVIAGGIVALHPRTLRALLDLGRRVTGRELAVPLPDGRRTAGLVLRYVPAWIGIVVATWSIARALDPDAPIARVALATVVSWIAGFLAVPVPAGGGIREAVFLAVAGLPLGVGAATALGARVLFVAVDGLGALAAGATTRRQRLPDGGGQD